LRSHLRRQADGFNIDLRSQIPGRDVPRENAIETVLGDIKSVSPPDWVVEYEEDEAKLAGPYSIMHPYAERADRVRQYYINRTVEPSNTDAIAAADAWLDSLVPAGSLRLTGLDTAFGMVPKDSNWGLPHLTRDPKLLPEYLERAQDMDEYYPAVLGWRGQQGGPKPEDVRQRVVFMVDHMLTIEEKSIQVPLLAVLRPTGYFDALINSESVDRSLTRAMQVAKNLGVPIHSLDYSRFDLSMPLWLSNRIWDWIESRFTSSANERIQRAREAFQNMGLVVPYEILEGETGAVPSGTALTNQFDSLANGYMQVYAAAALGTRVVSMQVMGDDGVVVHEDALTVDQLSEILQSDFGMTLNEEKGAVSYSQIRYLQYLYDDNYRENDVLVPVRSGVRMAARWIAYERIRRDWSKWLDSVRVIMTTETTWGNPAHERIVARAMMWDDVLRTYDPREVLLRAGGADDAVKALGIYSFPFTDVDLTGFDDFSTVREIRRLQMAR
jgi:hypothetical protein